MGKVRWNVERGAVPCKNTMPIVQTERPIELAQLTWVDIQAALHRSGYLEHTFAWRDLACREVRVDENGGNAQAVYEFRFNEGTATEPAWASGEVYISVRSGMLYGEY